jgi:ubiquinone/menaquinone biosynthesis C-methylase UbiE
MTFFRKSQQTYPNIAIAIYIQLIEKLLKGCQTVLDVGCGSNSPLQYLSGAYQLTGVDGFAQAIEESKSKNIHQKYYHADIKNLSRKFKSNSFNAVIALDVIEHLVKKDGYKLLKDMERIASKKVILNTPNGFVPQHCKKNNLQEHLSGWVKKDFEELGYKVYGMYGLRFLRKGGGELKIKPKVISGSISALSHILLTKHLPQLAYSLTAVKDLR